MADHPNRIRSDRLGENTMADLPAGTVTFLFTDIQGSTDLLKQLHKQYVNLLAEQRRILRTAFAKYGGQEVDTQGDAFFVSFPRATEAVCAVVEIQKSLAACEWPEGVQVQIRMGLHTGEPWLVEEGYVGMDVHRAARIAHVGHGGQVLLSETTTPLILDELPEGVGLLDLGRHRLKDMRRLEHLHQLVIAGLPEEFPPLKSLEALPTIEPPDQVEDGAKRSPRIVGPSPYRGLAAFQEHDAQFFFGREAFTKQVEETVYAQPLVAVIVGPSGSGKSSAVFAGLLPKLREAGGWLITQLRPGSRPFHALASALLPHLETDLTEAEALIETQKLAQAMQSGELPLIHLIDRVLAKFHQANRFLLVIDQFEELFTQRPDPIDQRQFMDELLAATEPSNAGQDSSLAVLLTLRADFMGQALVHRPFSDALQEGSVLLGPMNREELQAAIEKPAELQGAAFESGLVARILDDIGEEPGNLPLLEFALTLLWDRMEGGWLTHTAYEAIGRVEGALAQYAEATYAGFRELEKDLARRIFLQLVQPGQGTEDTRRVAVRSDLGERHWPLVRQLADHRLVVTGRDETGQETVEVVHEALIRSWGRLRSWINSERAFRVWQEGLRAALRGWEASARDDGALLRGAPLATASEWLATQREDLSSSETAFIEASIDLRERTQSRRERRRRLTIFGLTAGLLIALVLTVFAFNQRIAADQNAALANQNAATAEAERVRAEEQAGARATQQAIAESERTRAEEETLARATQQAIAEEQARVANARNLARIALENLGTDPQLGLLLALQAIDQTYSIDGTLLTESDTALHQALRHASRLQLTIPSQGAKRIYAYFSPGGTRVIAHYVPTDGDPNILSDQIETMIWDAASGDLLHTLPAGLVVAQWPPSDQVVIVNSTIENELEVNIWNSSTGEIGSQTILKIPANLTIDSINALVLNSDQSEIAIAWAGGARIGVWDLQNGENELIIVPVDFYGRGPRNRVGGPVAFISTLPTHLLFSADGKHLIALHLDEFRGTDIFLTLWDPATGAWESATSYDDPQYHFLSISLDGAWVAFPLAGYNLIKDVETQNNLTTLISPDARTFSTMAFSPDGALFAAANSDGMIYIWDLSRSLSSQSSQLLLTLSNPKQKILDLKFSPDGSRLMTAAEDGSIRIWDVRTNGGMELPAIGQRSPTDQFQGFSMALSPDGRQLAIGKSGEPSTIWDTGTGELLFSLQGETGGIEDLAFSPNGRMLATCSHAGPLTLWDASNGRALYSLDSYNEGRCTLDFHPDGKAIAVGFIKNEAGWFQIIEIPDLDLSSSGPVSLRLPFPWRGVLSGDLTHLDFNHQGDQLAGITDIGEFVVWDPRIDEIALGTGVFFDKSILLQEEYNYFDVVFSPDDTRMAATGIDGTLAIWDARTLEVLWVNSAHTGKVTAAAFSPNGETLTTGSTDRKIKIWDISTGQNLLTLDTNSYLVSALAYSPDGDRLYASNTDGTVDLYTMDVDELIQMSKSVLTRSLTTEECQTYLNISECPPSP
jgi:WD40 repeat protein/class 3 adenylate cyclase